jgi:hypothetical protein
MFTHPSFIETKAVHVLNEFNIALERERWALAA